jgi:hypothetical protein
MKNAELRARLAAALGVSGLVSAALLACGSDVTDGTNPVDAATESATDGNATDGTTAADAADAANAADATDDADAAASDADPDALPTVRRPFLVGAAMRSAASARRDDWLGARDRDARDRDARDGDTATDLDDKTRAALARAWLDDGLQEHASIAAFARFSMMLLGVGAPPDLVVQSQRASLEEIAHARACFALARRYGADDAGPGPLAVHDALAPFTLADLAALTAEEGCVGETLGVALATEQLARATDPVVRRTLARIVEDEARHAELAWRFVAWAIAEDARVLPAVLARIDAAIEATLRMEIRPPHADPIAWAAHGRLTCAEAREASARAIREVVVPCLDALRHAPRDAAAEAAAEADVAAAAITTV